MTAPLCRLHFYRDHAAPLYRAMQYTGVVRVMTGQGAANTSPPVTRLYRRGRFGRRARIAATIEHHAYVLGHVYGRYRFGWRARLRIWWVQRHIRAVVQDPVTDEDVRAALRAALLRQEGVGG